MIGSLSFSFFLFFFFSLFYLNGAPDQAAFTMESWKQKWETLRKDVLGSFRDQDHFGVLNMMVVLVPR